RLAPFLETLRAVCLSERAAATRIPEKSRPTPGTSPSVPQYSCDTTRRRRQPGMPATPRRYVLSSTATNTGTIQPHNQRPATVWSSGGSDYDQISRGIADSIEHCVMRLNPQPGERILDLSTGTGWTSRLVARRGASVVGADIAEDLLEAARARAAADGLSIEYRIGDAEDLPFATGEFDAVISTVGVMFASRQEAAAAELARVCRPGGRIALTTWTADGNVLKMFEVMKRYMPAPPNPAPRSPFEWGRTERIKELLGGAFDLKFEKAVSYYREPSPG